MAEHHSPRLLDLRLVLALLLLGGLSAIAILAAAGLTHELLHLVAAPPRILRAGLAGFAVVLGGWLALAAIERMNRSPQEDLRDPGEARAANLALVRAVRFDFLSAASFTAAGGWLLGDPFPLAIALVIAGVGVVDTSVLLAVARRHSP
jgi:hypothetical protein